MRWKNVDLLIRNVFKLMNTTDFFTISYPAQKEYQIVHAPILQSEPLSLCSEKKSNKRTIFKYIHSGSGIKLLKGQPKT